MTPTDLAGPGVPPTGPASAIDVLDGAAQLLRQGWVRGRLTDVVGGRVCYCLGGALIAAANRQGVSRMPAVDAVRAELRSRGVGIGIAHYNDDRADTVDDVLDVIEAAKARLT